MSTLSTPLVSVIIPTHRRPASLAVAVRSALGQTLSEIEVIVVFDGPDEVGRERVSAMGDSRLRVFEQAWAGQGAATNFGIRQARAPFAALLDDDDEWMVDKLARQYESATASQHARPVVGCRLAARSGSDERVWPRRTPKAGEAIGDYLFCRNDWFFGEALFQNSVIFAPVSLFREVPIRTCHSDWDWLLRVGALPGVGFEFVDDERPLAVWANDTDRPRASRARRWEPSFAWIRDSRDLLSESAYAAFLLRTLAAIAREEGAWEAWRPLWREARQGGRITWKDALTFAGIWLCPRRTRRSLGRIAESTFRFEPGATR